MNLAAAHASRGLSSGTPVEVRNRFLSRWTRGFEVVTETNEGYTVRRVSDRHVLPARFSGHEVRPAS